MRSSSRSSSSSNSRDSKQELGQGPYRSMATTHTQAALADVSSIHPLSATAAAAGSIIQSEDSRRPVGGINRVVSRLLLRTRWGHRQSKSGLQKKRREERVMAKWPPLQLPDDVINKPSFIRICGRSYPEKEELGSLLTVFRYLVNRIR